MPSDSCASSSSRSRSVDAGMERTLRPPAPSRIRPGEIDAFAGASGSPKAALCGQLNGGIGAYNLGHAGEAQRRFQAGERLLDIVDPGQAGTALQPPGQQSLLASYWGHRATVTCLIGEEGRPQEQSALAVAFGARASAAAAGTVGRAELEALALVLVAWGEARRFMHRAVA